MSVNARTYLYDGPASRIVDDNAREMMRVTGFELMQRAAHAAFSLAMACYPEAQRARVYCGKGNNGGDAYLVALYLKEAGITIDLVAIAPPSSLQGDALLAFEAAAAAGIVPRSLAEKRDDSSQADVIVDGLLGTGSSGQPRGDYADAISEINACGVPVVSIDLPSGIDAATGAAAGIAVRANQTISFITRKTGLRTGDGLLHAGRQHFADLGVDGRCYMETPVNSLRFDPGCLGSIDVGAYKHALGHVLVVGGERGMPGAVMLAGESALRVGAGMVTVCTRAEHAGALVTRRPELMVFDPDTSPVADKLTTVDMVVLGPGLGRSDWSRDLYLHVERSGLPLVLDADGLYWLAQRGAWHGGALYLTPHAAEAARLLGIAVSDIQKDRLASARRLVQHFGAQAALLKGAGSVVALADDTVWICEHGNPGMASAGMGDVLAGLSGGLLAPLARQGSLPTEGLQRFAQAVALHSLAGDLAAERSGQRSMLASDLIAEFADLIG